MFHKHNEAFMIVRYAYKMRTTPGKGNAMIEKKHNRCNGWDRMFREYLMGGLFEIQTD